jgi:AraC-like DNA-binding protein
VAGIEFYRDASLPFFELKVCQADHMAYKKHYHEEFSLGLVEQGASRVWHEGRQVEILPASLVLIGPGVFHACNPRDRARWRYKMLFVQPAWVESLGRATKAPALLAEGVRCLPAKDFKPLVAEAADCLMGEATPLATETGVLALFDAIRTAGGGEPAFSGGRERVRVGRLREYLQENYLGRVTLDDLEAVSGLSKYYVIKLFKRQYGVPPHVYQTMLRVNFARKELRRQRELAAVAQDAGFYDQSHFTKTFRSQVGVTPEVYQKAFGC